MSTDPHSPAGQADQGPQLAPAAPALRQELPTLRSRLPTLWTSSYLVATVDGATLEVVKRNVDNQRNVQDTGTPLPPHG
jgi:hypothetical protein